MATLNELLNPRFVIRKITEHGPFGIAAHLMKEHSRPLYDLTRRLETGWLRRREGSAVRERRQAAKAALSSEWAGTIPKAKGAAILPPGKLPGSEEVRAYCAALWHEKADLARAAGQTYTSLLAPDIRTVANGVVADLTDHKIIQDFATSSAMTAIVCDYLGEMPVIRDLGISVTHPNASLEGSQQYHVDYSPLPHVKFYMAIDDITSDCGPLTWIEADASARIRRRERHIYGRLQDAAISGAEVHQLEGPSGTSAFVDTSRCLHFGSRGNVKERVTLIVFYDLIGSHGTKPYQNAIILRPEDEGAAQLLTMA